MRHNLFWLSDEQWKRIEPHLPTDIRGVDRADDRRVISGIVHVLNKVPSLQVGATLDGQVSSQLAQSRNRRSSRRGS